MCEATIQIKNILRIQKHIQEHQYNHGTRWYLTEVELDLCLLEEGFTETQINSFLSVYRPLVYNRIARKFTTDYVFDLYNQLCRRGNDERKTR